jgi:peptidyl-tRNA hydrolase, PTH1 family
VSLQLIVGLGNPGKGYEKTRHNVGFWFIQVLAEQFTLVEGLKIDKKFNSVTGALAVDSQKYFLIEPQTYMNESGRALAQFSKFYKIPSTNILVVHDDLDFPCGKIHLKFGGGHGGHNGLRNIIQYIGTDFWRLRIGIDHPKHKDLVHDYVLSTPTVEQRLQIQQSIDEIMPLIPILFKGHFEQVMCQLHTQPTEKIR